MRLYQREIRPVGLVRRVLSRLRDKEDIKSMEIVEFIFRGFWTFIGFALLLNIILFYTINFTMKVWNRTLRHWNIRKHGYPPEHCDADGDFNETT